ESDRASFEPVVFYGCLPSNGQLAHNGTVGGIDGPLNVYVAFGTMVWRPLRDEVLAAARAVCDYLGERQDARAVVSYGRADLGAATVRSLRKANVSVESFVDQWELLSQADVFVTHHGLNSTHEAIFHGVPMISYPFFWDQPALAEKCRSLGLAV